MKKLELENLDVEKKRVLMRVDFNVPLDGEGNVMDASRIEAALPSIRYVLDRGASLVLMSHLGRPKNEPAPHLSLKPVAKVLQALLKTSVKLAPDCIGEEVEELIKDLKGGEVLLLENLRFHRAETHPEEDLEFAKKLAQFGDVYVNDAFGTAHRKHSSTYTVAKHFLGYAAAGFLLSQEIHFLGQMLTDPKRPFYALLGGAKIATKIGVIKTLLQKADKILVGGGMAYTFLKAKGYEISNSLVDDELLMLAKELLESARDKIMLPIDVIAAKECSEDAATLHIDVAQGIPQGYEGLDIGPKTVALFSEIFQTAKTVLWNGPLGVYELDPFALGTKAIADVVGKLDAVTIIGGGDLIAAVNQAEMGEKISHISTGGGATLEYLEYGTLPCIEALSDQ